LRPFARFGGKPHLPSCFQATTTELVRALIYPKFKLSQEEQQEFLADYLPHCVTIHVPAEAPKVPEYRDPADVPFLQLAIVGKASFLVTGDRDLLNLAAQFSIPIVRPAVFLDEVSSR
jgi:uncharacterized protein